MEFEHYNSNGITSYVMTVNVDESCYVTTIMSHILSQLGIQRSQEKVILWIFDNVDNDCRLIDTVRDIAKKVGVSVDTVRKAMKTLQDLKILTKVRNGVYSIDSSFILKDFKGEELHFTTKYLKKAQKIDIVPEKKNLSRETEEKLPKKSKEKPPWVVANPKLDPDEDFY